MERRATVARIEGDFALLKLSAQAGCGRCSQPGGCSGGGLNQWLGGACSLHKLPNPDGAALGEEVALVTPDGGVWRAALVLYGLPLLAGLVGAMVGALSGGVRSDGLALLGFVLGLAAGWALGRRIAGSPGWRKFSPRIRRLGDNAGAPIHWSKDVK